MRKRHSGWSVYSYTPCCSRSQWSSLKTSDPTNSRAERSSSGMNLFSKQSIHGPLPAANCQIISHLQCDNWILGTETHLLLEAICDEASLMRRSRIGICQAPLRQLSNISEIYSRRGY